MAACLVRLGLSRFARIKIVDVPALYITKEEGLF